MTPLHTQKLILFILQRSMKNCVLLVGVYVASLEGFATVIVFVSLTCGITFNTLYVIFFADDLFVLEYEHVYVLLYGNSFNNDVNERFFATYITQRIEIFDIRDVSYRISYR